jgi:23S rRNA (uracil1939-C5)-methyltransferase
VHAAGGFQQANWAQNDRLRALVREAARDALGGAPGRRVLELYAGAGNFTRDLVTLAPSGVAVESDREAARRLRTLVPAGWTARAESAERVVRQFAAAGQRFDLVVLDPPRAGAAELIGQLPSLTERIVYVSCDPMTLARDLGQLTGRGWAQPIDMMPHTSHVEVVVYWEKGP